MDVFIPNFNYVLLREVVRKYECRSRPASTLVQLTSLEARCWLN